MGFFPMTVYTAFVADRRMLFYKYFDKKYRAKKGVIVQSEKGDIENRAEEKFREFEDLDEMDPVLAEFERNRREYINAMKRIRLENPNISLIDLETKAREEVMSKGPKSRAYYRAQATRKLAGKEDAKKAMGKALAAEAEAEKKDDGVTRIMFAHCVYKGAHRPLPFNLGSDIGCDKARTAGYLQGCAALCIIGLITDFFGTVLTCLGLKSTDPNKKYKYYRVSIYALIVAGTAFLLTVIIYPVQFAKDLDDEPAKNGLVVEPTIDRGDVDFDNDGIPNHVDDDDDGDNIPDHLDPDDDNDNIPDELDDDDDNDGVSDLIDKDDNDFDNDGIPNNLDDDDDNDNIPDDEDPDDDNDDIDDVFDSDDDNDGILDVDEADTEGDGVLDIIDPDVGNDGKPDTKDDEDFDNDGTPNSEDDDDDDDGQTDNVDPDDDNDGQDDVDDDDDGIPDEKDNDRDGDGLPNAMEIEGTPRVYSFGFGYGATWGSIILIYSSVVLLICDRESEEIFYKERQMEEDEEEETGEA